MKNFILSIACLTMLFACGGDKKSSTTPALERYEEALRNISRGMVSKTVTQNASYFIGFDSESQTFTVDQRAYESTETSVVLRVDGRRVYKYESHRIGEGPATAQVTLEVLSSAEDIRELINMGARVQNDWLFLNFSEPVSTETVAGPGRAEISSVEEVALAVNLLRPYCDSRVSFRTTAAWFSAPGIHRRLPDLSGTSVTTCDEPLNSVQLKSIDLSSVIFCEEIQEEYSCAANQDLRFLIDDL